MNPATEFLSASWSALRGPGRSPLTSVGAWVALILPVLLGLWLGFSGRGLHHPVVLVTGMALIFGGYLSAFVFYSSMRSRLAEREDLLPHAESSERNLADRVATLLLFGATISALAAGATCAALIFTPEELAGVSLDGIVGGAMAALCSAPVMLFLYTAPLLYRGYTQLTVGFRPEFNR